MGSLIASLARQSEDLSLAGLLERPGHTDIPNAACPVSSDIESLLSASPGAVVIDFTTPEASMQHARRRRPTAVPSSSAQPA